LLYKSDLPVYWSVKLGFGGLQLNSEGGLRNNSTPIIQ
jgi:hypothetical protein